MATYSHGFYEKNAEGIRQSAREIVPLVMDLVHPSSVVDIGCGIGNWLLAFQEPHGRWQHAHPRTLRRTFLNRPGTLRETPEALLVELDWFPEQTVLRPLVDALNAARVQLPGPGGRHRRLFLALAEDLA